MKHVYLTFLLTFFLLTTLAQNKEAPASYQFQDDLLDHLIGKWSVTGVVHGMQAKLIFQGEWILNHQFLRVYEKSEGNIPGLDFPFENFLFVGYDNYTKRYIPQLISMWGGTCSQNTTNAYRTDNEFKLVIVGPCVIGVERFTWEPATRSWHIESRPLQDGKEGEPYLDLHATYADR